MYKDIFKISSKKFKSRLIVGTGKYKNFNECAKAVKISGADIVTVAVRRVNISNKNNSIDIIIEIQQLANINLEIIIFSKYKPRTVIMLNKNPRLAAPIAYFK